MKSRLNQNNLFYVSAGRGTEDFARREIKNKLIGSIISPSKEEHARDGKIFFNFENDFSFNSLLEMLKLKSVERIFVAISNYQNAEFIKGKRNFLDKLMGEMTCTSNYTFAQLVLQQLISLSQGCKNVNPRATDTEHNIQPATKKTKLEENNEDKDSNIQPTAKKARLESIKDNSCSNEGICDVQVENSKQDICCTSSDIMSSNSNSNKEKNMPDDIINLTVMPERNEILDHEISFRISIKCSGKTSRWMNIKKLSKDLSWRVIKVTGWTVDLRNPMFEICMHISDQYVTVGIPLTRVPLSRRNYVVDHGLRGPIAWIMMQLAEINVGDLVLDPMCGKGTLLLESCSELKNAIYVGVDNDTDQLTTAMKNVSQVGFEKRITFLQADALSLPLKSNSVNAVMCDAPFNQKYFTSIQADKFYHSFLLEMTRILQMDAKLVLLVSEELSGMIIRLLQDGSGENVGSPLMESASISSEKEYDKCTASSLKVPFTLLSNHNVKLGETLATILVLKKINL